MTNQNSTVLSGASDLKVASNKEVKVSMIISWVLGAVTGTCLTWLMLYMMTY